MSTPKSQSASLNWRVQANALTEPCGWICVLSKLPNKGSPGKRSSTRFAAQVAEKPIRQEDNFLVCRRSGSSFWPKISAHLVCRQEPPLRRKFEFACQAHKSCLIADRVVSGEYHCRSQERIVFGQSCLQPFEGRGLRLDRSRCLTTGRVVRSNGCATQDRSGELPGEEALKKRREFVGAGWELLSSIANLMKLHFYDRID